MIGTQGFRPMSSAHELSTLFPTGKSKPRRSASIRALLATVSIAGTLAGCAVSPVPLTPPQLQAMADSNASRVTANQEPINGSVSLYEAMARALKYNLDYKVESMQHSLRTAELNVSHYNMLPNAVVNSGYTARDSYYSSGERNLTTGVETAPRETSQEKRVSVSDMTFSWNILDFGLSYIRAHQSADRVLIAEEARRRVIQRVIEDVRTAYWRAVSADRMVKKLTQLEGRTKQALTNAKALFEGKEASPITGLTYERELIEIKRTAQELRRELSVAKTQLAALMNIPPDASFTLTGEEINAKAPVIGTDAREMTAMALLNRPELRDIAYQRRINENEAHAALLELLPGIQIYGGANYDTNKYLDHNQWVNWGAKASFNVMKVFQYPGRKNVINAQDELLDARALALTMAVMTQVHVSRIRFAHLSTELVTARSYFDVQQRLVNQMRAEAAADRISEQTLVREEMNTLVAEAKRDIAYASTQNAFANLFASVGLDPYASEIDTDLNVKALAARIKGLWLERGDFGAHSKIKLAQR
jgi:outer membrane protein TolC